MKVLRFVIKAGVLIGGMVLLVMVSNKIAYKIFPQRDLEKVVLDKGKIKQGDSLYIRI